MDKFKAKIPDPKSDIHNHPNTNVPPVMEMMDSDMMEEMRMFQGLPSATYGDED